MKPKFNTVNLTPYVRFSTIEGMRNFNAQYGYHWFDRDTMRFFNSRIEKVKGWPLIMHSSLFVHRNGFDNLFVTSETYDENRPELFPRLYTVRQLLPDATVQTIGTFQHFASAELAFWAIFRLFLVYANDDKAVGGQLDSITRWPFDYNPFK